MTRETPCGDVENHHQKRKLGTGGRGGVGINCVFIYVQANIYNKTKILVEEKRTEKIMVASNVPKVYGKRNVGEEKKTFKCSSEFCNNMHVMYIWVSFND